MATVYPLRIQERPKFFNSDGYGPRLKTVFTQVLDCGARRSGFSNVKEYDSSGLLINSVFFGDPRIVDLPSVVQPKSIFDSLFGLICPPRNAGRILPNEEIVSDKYWKNLVPIWGAAAITGTLSVKEDSIEVKGEEVTALLLGTGLRPTSTTLSMYDVSVPITRVDEAKLIA